MKVKKRGFLCLTVIGLLWLIAYDWFPAEAYSEDKRESPFFEVDAVNLASKDPLLSRLDVYIKISYAALQFVRTPSDEFLGEYRLSVRIDNHNSAKPVDGEVLNQRITLDDMSETRSVRSSQVSHLSFDLPPDRYLISIDLQDLETSHKTHQERSVSLKDYSNGHIAGSEILCLDHFSEDEAGNVQIHPRITTTTFVSSEIYAYFEIYNVPHNERIRIEYKIQDSEKATVIENAYVIRSQGGTTRTALKIPADSLMHGEYLTKIKTRIGEHSLNLERPLSWYWSDIPSSFSSLDEAVQPLKYITSEEEWSRLNDSTGRQRYSEYTRFWQRRDPSPGTPDNESRDEYYRRIAYANHHYYGVRKKGWKTDMGWVYVKLGPADNIDRKTIDDFNTSRIGPSIKALQTWEYHNFQRQLVFVDEIGFGEFRLENTETFYDMLRLVQ